MYDLTRRNFLKTVGMGGLMLATSPLLSMPKSSVTPETLNCFPFHPTEWNTFFNNKTKLPVKKQPVKVGDTIRFLPEVIIDGFSAIDEGDNFFRHIILNVYEFTFRPIQKNLVPLPPQLRPKKYIEDLLVNVSSSLIAVFSRWTTDKDENLKIGLLYKGYGTIGNYDNNTLSWYSSDFAGSVEDLKINAKVERILDYNLYHTWGETIETRINYLLSNAFFKNRKRTYTGDLLYYQDFSKFKKAVIPYQNKFNEIKTNKSCALPTYCLQII